MKGKGAKTIKKVVSIILALAMVVTGVNYTPVSVNAADRISIQLNGKTYTVEKTSSSIVGYVMGTADNKDDVNARFVFQWDASTGPRQVTAVVKQGEETKETLENQTNGFGIYIKNIQNYEDGDYVITITDNNAGSTQQATVKLTVSTYASDKAPDYSGVTVADNDWTELGTGAEGEKWYISNSYFTALKGSGFRQMVSKGSELTYIDKDNITVTGPAIGFGIPSQENFESAWVNDTKLAIGDKFFKSKTNVPDVLALSQDLFKDGEISYITVRYKDGTDKIIPVKRDKISLKPDLVTYIDIMGENRTVGSTINFKVTVKNEGEGDAVLTTRNDTETNLVLKWTNNKTEKDWYITPISMYKSKNSSPVLEPGDEISHTFEVTLTAEMLTGSYMVGGIVKLEGGLDATINESNTANNQSEEKVITVLPEVTLANNDGTITAEADVKSGVTNYKLTYVSGGNTVTVESNELTIEEGKVKYTFTKNTAPDNNTEVTVLNSDTGDKIAVAKAFADLVITGVETDGVATVGNVTGLKINVKNIGVAPATSTENNRVYYLVEALSDYAGDVEITKAYVDVADGLAPNETTTVEGIEIKPKAAKEIKMYAYADEHNAVAESDNGVSDKNRYEFSINPTLSGTLKVENVGGVVTATWAKNEASDEPLGYVLSYYSNGVLKTIETGNTTTTSVISEKIDYKSTITIASKYSYGNTVFAQQVALPDLKIKSVQLSGGVSENQSEIYKGKMFSVKVTFENVGITEVPKSSGYVTPDTGAMPDYGKRIMVSLDGTTNVAGYDDVGKKQFVSEGVWQGVDINSEHSVTFDRLVSPLEGATEFTVKVDSPSFTGTEAEGFISESDETNNSLTVTKNTVKLVEGKEMDWTKFKSTDVNNLDENGNPYIIINNGSDKRYLEYKVLDASITDVDYADIMTDVSAYSGQFIRFLINNRLPMVKSTGGTITSKMYFAQVSSYTAENYTKDMDADINYGTERKVNDGVLQTWDGNGYQLYTRSFAAGKYYIVKVVNNDGTYLTLGLRIPGDMGNWVKAKASDNSDPDKVPVVYHDKNHLIEGTIYYDGSDLGLAGMAVYNSDHLALTIDGTKKINTNGNSNNWKMTIAYASVDDKGKFIEQIANDTLAHIGTDPGTVELLPREELYSTQGENTILIKLPELMQELPIHSELGGEKGSEYYILKVYYDTENHPDEYVPVPLRIVGNIPEIEGVNGLTAGKKGDALTVSWTNSITQEADGYLYDVLIYTCDKDGINEKLVKTEEGVQAGSHTYENLVPSREIDNTNFKVKVVAHWCEQVTDAEDAVVTVIANLPNPLPGEDPDRREDKWVLIDGEYYLPINDGKGNETMAEVWYYTDENMDAVIGYNDKYITLNGNEKYFVGSNTQLFVQNDDETGRKFVAKTIYDTVYKGQLQMDAYRMFSVYEGGPASDGFYYYTVKVRDGENTDNTYNFYFRVKVTDNPTKRDNSEEWKLVKGTGTLPVKFNYSYEKQSKDNDGNNVMETVNKSLEINGTIEFYDAPDKTNTYAVTGYNSYYMSLIGKNDVYAGTNKGTNSVSMEIVNTGTEDNSSLINTDSKGNIPAAELTYAQSEVYDSLYPGETQINAPTVFTVTNPTTYFMLKITGTAEDGTVTTKYLPIRITVNTGNVKLEGYQINTNTAKGAVSEFNPSYRVMSSADQVILGSDNKLHGVKGFGTIYGLKSRVASASDMTVDSANKNVYTYEATSMGIYETGLFGMSNIKTEDTKRTYWALTFKHLNYSYAALVSNYVLRAYAILDNGEIVYDNDSFGFGESDVNIYNIATNLYEGKKMPNKAAHEFLFNNVISIVDINNHISQIGMAMLTNAGNENYTTVNNVYHDLFDYARGQEAYSGADEYTNRQTTGFVARSEVGSESSLLQILNTKTGTTYSNLIDWIAGETTGLIHEKVVFTNNTVMN